MSAKATSWAWDLAIPQHSAKLVLLCLADSHDAHSGRCALTADHIAKMTGLSEKTVRAAIAILKERGLVEYAGHSVSAPGFSLDMGVVGGAG